MSYLDERRYAIQELILQNQFALDCLKAQFEHWEAANAADPLLAGDLTSLEQLLSRHETDLEEGLKNMQERFKRSLARRCHSDRLPVELLRKIIIEACDDGFKYSDNGEMIGGTVCSPFRLSHVSRRWRIIARSIVSLWTNVFLSSATCKKPMALHLFETLAEYIPEYSLDVTIEQVGGTHDILPILNLKDAKAIKSLTFIMAPHSSRTLSSLLVPEATNLACNCKTLRFRSPGHESRDIDLDAMFLHFSGVENIVICGTGKLSLAPSHKIEYLTEITLEGDLNVSILDLLRLASNLLNLRFEGYLPTSLESVIG